MGGGASVSPKVSGKTTPKHSDLEAIKEINNEIERLERASKDVKALDEYIDATQAYSQASMISRTPATKLVTDNMQETMTRLSRYFDDIDRHLEMMRKKLGEFKDSVFQRCDKYSEDEKLVKMSRARQQINVVDELILKAKDRLISAKKDKKTADIVKTMKKQVQDLEVFKSELKSSGIDSARSNNSETFEKVLSSEGSEYVIEDILKWRDEALKLRRKYESLLDDNEKLKAESEEEIIALHDSNKKFIKEVMELRKDAEESDEKVEKFQNRVQLIEEKLLDERLSHEVEINSLRAMLEKKDELINRLLGKSNPVTPAPARGDVRLSPEGFLGSENEMDKKSTKSSRSPSPTKAKHNETDEPKPDNENSADSFRMWINAFKPRDSADSVKEQVQNHSNNAAQKASTETQTDCKETKSENLPTENESAEIKMTLDELQETLIDKADKNEPLITQENKGNIKENQKVKEKQTEDKTEKVVTEKVEPKSILKKSRKGKSENQDATVTPNKGKPEGTKSPGVRNYQANDIVVYEEGTTKEIVYRRNDSEIDGNLSYHRGVGAVLQTSCTTFGVDSISCEIIDELEIEMLPDFVEGERAVSFQLHFQKKPGVDLTLKEGESFKLFVPHRHIHEFEEASLIQSVSDGDWEPCDSTNELPTSVEDVKMVCTEIFDLTDIKLIVIAREKVENIIAGEEDIFHKAKYDSTVTLKMTKDAFRSRTEVKLLVHDTHFKEMLTAVEIHDECKQIMSCTAFVSILSEQITKEDISVTMELPEDIDKECKYIMFCLDDHGWTLADCDWEKENKVLEVHLRAGQKKYRILGLELPKVLTAEEQLLAVKTLHDHTSHYLVRILFRQREDDPKQAVVICLRSAIVKTGIYELKELGYSIGGYPSSQFCLLEGDTLSLQFSGDVSATPVNSEKIEMTFYPQKEIATKQLMLQNANKGADDSVSADDQTQGYLTVIKKDESKKIILGETIKFRVDKEAADSHAQKAKDEDKTICRDT